MAKGKRNGKKKADVLSENNKMVALSTLSENSEENIEADGKLNSKNEVNPFEPSPESIEMLNSITFSDIESLLFLDDLDIHSVKNDEILGNFSVDIKLAEESSENVKVTIDAGCRGMIEDVTCGTTLNATVEICGLRTIKQRHEEFLEFEGIAIKKTTVITQVTLDDNLEIVQTEETPENTTERKHTLTSDLAVGFLSEGASLLLMRVLAKCENNSVKPLDLFGIDSLGQPCRVFWNTPKLIEELGRKLVHIERRLDTNEMADNWTFKLTTEGRLVHWKHINSNIYMTDGQTKNVSEREESATYDEDEADKKEKNEENSFSCLYKCSECRKICDTEKEFAEHMENTHTIEEPKKEVSRRNLLTADSAIPPSPRIPNLGEVILEAEEPLENSSENATKERSGSENEKLPMSADNLLDVVAKEMSESAVKNARDGLLEAETTAAIASTAREYSGFKQLPSVESWSSSLKKNGSIESLQSIATLSGLGNLFDDLPDIDEAPKIIVVSNPKPPGDSTYAEVVQNIKRVKLLEVGAVPSQGPTPLPTCDEKEEEQQPISGDLLDYDDVTSGTLDLLFEANETIGIEVETPLNVERENTGSSSSELLNLFQEPEPQTVEPVSLGVNKPGFNCTLPVSPHVPSNLENRPVVEPRLETMLDIDEGLGTEVSSKLSERNSRCAGEVLNERYLEMKDKCESEAQIYLEEHKEIKDLITDFVQCLLIAKPTDPRQFAAAYFNLKAYMKNSEL